MLILPAVLVLAAALVALLYVFQAIPLPESVGAQPTLLLDSQQREIGALRPETSRQDIELAQLPEHVRKAVLAAEDDDFYAHRGISLPGIFRAAIRNVTTGTVREGGSTITQQYIKNVTQDRDRTMVRKVREAVLAVKLERTYSKDQILEFYLNSIYFGRGAYGIRAAAHAYYGKLEAELSVPEAALLAGVIAAPSAYDPARNEDAALRRFEYVLDRMVDNRWLDPVEAGRFVGLGLPPTLPPTPVVFREAPYFLDLVSDWLERRFGERLYQGMRVTTTLDLPIQHNAEAAFRRAFSDGAIDPAITGALVAMDPATGGVRALVGGRDYAHDQVNGALALRQPGSTFKPFTLAAYVEQGKSPESYFDAPARMTFAAEEIGEPDDWEVSNYEDRGYGEMSLREATWKSVNTVYAQVMLDVGKDSVVELARAAGIETPLEPVASVVLGTEEVSPLELAAAYNTFAAGGIRRDWYVVERVERDGEIIFQAPHNANRAFSEQVAWTVADTLQGVLRRGTGTAARLDRDAAGKTGTTQDYADAWFAGYTPHLTAVVWMGNRDNNRPMSSKYTGGSVPARMWQDFMAATLVGISPVDFPQPSGSLKVVRPSPLPSPTQEELRCDADEVRSEGSDGEVVCVEASPVEEAATPADEATGEPEGSDDDAAQPAPTQPTPPQASPAPTAASPKPSGGEPSPTAPGSEPTGGPTPAATANPAPQPTGLSGATPVG